MELLPYEVTEDMKECAYAAAWHTANTRKGYKGDAAVDKIHFADKADAFKQKAKGILTEKVCDDIKWMFWNAAWYAANTTWGYKSDAAKDKQSMDKYHEDIAASKDIHSKLAENIREMGLAASWECANKRKGQNDDAKVDEAKVNSYFQKISGTPKLVSMRFIKDTEKILNTKPLALAEETVINKGDVPQMMNFSFSSTEGRTKSMSTTVGFRFTVTEEFSVGFEDIVKDDFTVSFQLSASKTMAASMSRGVTKTYTFPLTVPAKSTYTAKATTQEADMQVDYEMVLDIGGYKKAIHGTWTGVAVSKANFEIIPN